jgi:hypothetical protein
MSDDSGGGSSFGDKSPTRAVLPQSTAEKLANRSSIVKVALAKFPRVFAGFHHFVTVPLGSPRQIFQNFFAKLLTVSLVVLF